MSLSSVQLTLNSDHSTSFQKIKPLCINLIKQPSVENVTALREALHCVAPEVAQDLQEYILLPLTTVFKTGKRAEAVLIETLGCLCDLLKVTVIYNWDVFSDLFLHMLVIVSIVTDKLEVSSVSEELKLAFIHGLTSLVDSASARIRTEMLGTDFRLCLSHSVTILLALAQERNRMLQVAAMQCLDKMTCSTVADVQDEEDFGYHLGNAFAGFLPGISIALSQVILSSNWSQKVQATALNLWTHVIVASLGDNSLGYYSAKSSKELQSEVTSKIPKILRNDEWVHSTAEKLSILVRRVHPAVMNAGPKAKVAFVSWAQEILLKCRVSFKALTSQLLEVILTLSTDDDDLVANAGRSALDEVSHCMPLENVSLVETLEGELCKMLVRFPSTVITGTESEKRALVKLLSGYLMVLRENINGILISPLACQRLLNALFQLTEFDTTDIRLLAERDAPSEIVTSVQKWSRSYHKQFKYFEDIKIFEDFTKVCKNLGHYGNTMLLMDVLQQKVQESSVYRKQAILILNHVLLGCKNVEDDASLTSKERELDASHIRSLLEYYLSQKIWDLPLQVPEARDDETNDDAARSLVLSSDSLSLEKINSNILQVCLLLEGISVFASILKQNFRPLLRMTVCPLLERAGSHNQLVSHVACTSLVQISESCCYRSVSELIQENVDYITNALIFKLKHFKTNPDIPCIVHALAKHCTRDAMGLIEDVTHEVLNTLDFCYDKHSLLLLRALDSTAFAIASWFPPAPKQPPTLTDQRPVADSFTKFAEEFHQNKLLSRSIEEDCDETKIGYDRPAETEADDETGNLEEIQKEVPAHVKLLAQILKRCIHLQSSTNIWVHTAVFSIIQHSIVAMSDHEDEVLPIVHRLWGPLTYRFSKDDMSLSLKAFETLVCLADAAGSFIRQRTIKEVWPKLAQFLEKQHSVSRGKGKSYKITAAYKYQLALLTKLGLLACKLEICEEDVASMVSIIIRYIETSQPAELQLASLGCMKLLSKCSPDCVWYFLMRTYYQQTQPWSPTPALREVKFLPTMDCPNTNARSLLEYINSP